MTSIDSTVVRSVVLIDDDADFLHVMQRRLQAERSEYSQTGPVEIRLFTDPVEALVNLPAEGICVVILDYQMPESTGLDWLPKLLKVGLGPVILLTNQNDAKVAADAFRAGAADYIAKSDVTADDKRLGRAIREAVHRYRLEVRNASLTRQLKLLNVELEAKNKRLGELTETAHQFVDDVAHDFRTPLTVIQQYASIVAEGLGGPVTDRQREHLEVVADATRDLSEMVDDFLDSSKLRARALSVDRQCHTAQELWESIEPMLEVRARPKQISVEKTIADNLMPFFGDLSKVNRVFTNLIVNAIKVTPNGRTLRLWARPSEVGDVLIGVTDEGPGLKPEDLKLIFDRFKQLNETSSAETKGFGLGLSIVKQLAWLNLGKIEVQSEVGKGSSFAFTLPAFDLRRIIACYLENIKALEEPESLWMLHISARNGTLEPQMLRRLVSSFSYPMDLVLLDVDTQTVDVVGVSRDADAWANRLRGAIEKFNRSIGQQTSADLEIKTAGPWLRDVDTGALSESLLESLSIRSCHV